MSSADTKTGTPAERAGASVGRLQQDLRGLFASVPPHRALAESLARISTFLGAQYAVVHAHLGLQFLSEEWAAEDFEPSDPMRESVNDTLGEALQADRAKAVRLRNDASGQIAVIAAPIHDATLEQAGGAGLVILRCSREDAVWALSLFEGLIGYVALLATGGEVAGQTAAATDEDDAAMAAATAAGEAARVADHPVRLAYAMAGRLKNKWGLDQTAIGFVRRDRVRVVAVCGLDEVRGANPGVKLMAGAMEECLDLARPVLYYGYLVDDDTTQGDHCRLHAQWSTATGGECVASFPLRSGDEIVGIASVRHHDPQLLDPVRLDTFANDLANFGATIPLAQVASRSLLAHLRDSTASALRAIFGAGSYKKKSLLLTAVLLMLWMAFGTVTYSVMVPCSISGANRRTVTAMRDGILLEVVARPGSLVRVGETLAIMDARDDELERIEVLARLRSIEATVDKERAEGNAGQVRVLQAQRGEILAELAAVNARIERSVLRSPITGVVLEGDLRSRVGAKLAVGDPMFEIGRRNQVLVELQVPEIHVQHLDSCVAGKFAPAARPTDRLALGDLRLAAVSQVVDGRNVVIAETALLEPTATLLPGMSGFAHLDLGPRPVWWTMSRRILDWLRLRFWI
ncbi:MAG: HlyD family efflux transporter periplasmic adaptor subunit [Planctomycetota bacterium]